ncbi:carbon storage regulator [compost metagenome]
MLKLTRRIDQSILLTIDDDVDPVQLVESLRQGITITLYDIIPKQSCASIGVHAPREVRIMRTELLSRSD